MRELHKSLIADHELRDHALPVVLERDQPRLPEHARPQAELREGHQPAEHARLRALRQLRVLSQRGQRVTHELRRFGSLRCGELELLLHRLDVVGQRRGTLLLLLCRGVLLRHAAL